MLDVVHLGPQRDVAAMPEKPKDAGMVVYHHTRNTVEKQWDETRVLALHGVLRVFRAFGATLSARLTGFGDAWTKLIRYAATFACMGSAEVTVVRPTETPRVGLVLLLVLLAKLRLCCWCVAVRRLTPGDDGTTQAAVNGMSELLIAEAARPDFDRGFWEQSLDVWDEVAAHVCAVRGVLQWSDVWKVRGGLWSVSHAARVYCVSYVLVNRIRHCRTNPR